MTRSSQSLILESMNKTKAILLNIIGLTLLFTIAACSDVNTKPTTVTLVETAGEIKEITVLEIPLSENIGSPQMEFSGLGWYGDLLVLLPQYPKGIMGYKDGMLYGVTKQELIAWQNEPNTVLDFFEIPFEDDRLSKTLAGFEGFEAILFLDDEVFLTIETHSGDPMKSYLVKGSVEHPSSGKIAIHLDAEKIVELPAQNQTRNASYEAITSDGTSIFTFFEQYGEDQNTDPRVIEFDRDLNELGSYPIVATNFRLTDASSMQLDQSFWMINYFFPGDDHLEVQSDPISIEQGLPGSHAGDPRVERLVKFELRNGIFQLADETPIYLELLENGESRNWEGLVTLDDSGFVIVTDKFPESLLGLVIIK